MLVAALLFQVALAASPGGGAGPDSVALVAARNVHAVRAADPVRVDGILDDSIWTQATPVSGFTQRVPNEGAPASERTEVRVVFDNNAIYIAAELFDTAPDSIRRRVLVTSRQRVAQAGNTFGHDAPPHPTTALLADDQTCFGEPA